MGDGGGDPIAFTEGRGGVGVRRGPASTGGHGGRATAAATTVAEDEGCSAEAVVSPFEVSVLLVELQHLPLVLWSYADQVCVLSSAGSIRRKRPP